jgi:peptidoglycan/LPS O-acetylase OafA/YrhL
MTTEKFVISKDRDTKFELLRLIAMFSIVLCHYSAHSGTSVSDMYFGANKIILEFIGLGGNFGNITFVLLARI